MDAVVLTFACFPATHKSQSVSDSVVEKGRGTAEEGAVGEAGAGAEAAGGAGSGGG